MSAGDGVLDHHPAAGVGVLIVQPMMVEEVELEAEPMVIE